MNQFVPNSCVSFTSGIGAAQHTDNWNRVRDVNGGVTMILVTPEKVFKSNKLKAELQKLKEQNRLGRFVIDECHCACQWGHDFRPDYAKISVLRTHFPTVPILAVTATASDQVREDCVSIFQLSRDYLYFRSTADRPNLKYQVRPKESANDVIKDMVTFIREKHGKSAGIVYTYSRKDADTVADQLCEEGIIAESYHSEQVFFVMSIVTLVSRIFLSHHYGFRFHFLWLGLMRRQEEIFTKAG
jgi:ATP-dependent DNA helicase Q1